MVGNQTCKVSFAVLGQSREQKPNDILLPLQCETTFEAEHPHSITTCLKSQKETGNT